MRTTHSKHHNNSNKNNVQSKQLNWERTNEKRNNTEPQKSESVYEKPKTRSESKII